MKFNKHSQLVACLLTVHLMIIWQRVAGAGKIDWPKDNGHAWMAETGFGLSVFAMLTALVALLIISIKCLRKRTAKLVFVVFWGAVIVIDVVGASMFGIYLAQLDAKDENRKQYAYLVMMTLAFAVVMAAALIPLFIWCSPNYLKSHRAVSENTRTD